MSPCQAPRPRLMLWRLEDRSDALELCHHIMLGWHGMPQKFPTSSTFTFANNGTVPSERQEQEPGESGRV